MQSVNSVIPLLARSASDGRFGLSLAFRASKENVSLFRLAGVR
jgi:hypothetical protein